MENQQKGTQSGFASLKNFPGLGSAVAWLGKQEDHLWLWKLKRNTILEIPLDYAGLKVSEL